MEFQSTVVALGDFAWILVAFVTGLISRLIGLPPLVGFLAAGFLLNACGVSNSETLQKISELGITLLLFTIGLKLNLRTLVRPQVWAVTIIQIVIVSLVFGVAIIALAFVEVPLLSGLETSQAMLVAFALSFSSTVFVVKVLEERGEIAALHGRISIGILIVQDIVAVLFIAISSGEGPSSWVLFLLLLIPLRPLLHRLLDRVGHGELFVLFGFLLAMGGAKFFELVDMKGDLGALVLGVLIAGHSKGDELAKTILRFKDLFLLGFFLSIGLSGELTVNAVFVGALIVPLIFFKSVLFFGLLTQFGLRARTSLFASLNLTNFSEFGLIVAAIGVANGWIDNQLLVVIAIALSLSLAVSAALNGISQSLYSKGNRICKRWEKSELVFDDRLFNIEGASVAIIGMGGIGTGAYDKMSETHPGAVVGIDIDPITAENQKSQGRNVLVGDPSDADFWDRIQAAHSLEIVMLALPKLTANIAVLNQLEAASFSGHIAATAKFQDEIKPLKDAGAKSVYNVYTEAGAGFAGHVGARSDLNVV